MHDEVNSQEQQENKTTHQEIPEATPPPPPPAAAAMQKCCDDDSEASSSSPGPQSQSPSRLIEHGFNTATTTDGDGHPIHDLETVKKASTRTTVPYTMERTSDTTDTTNITTSTSNSTSNSNNSCKEPFHEIKTCIHGTDQIQDTSAAVSTTGRGSDAANQTTATKEPTRIINTNHQHQHQHQHQNQHDALAGELPIVERLPSRNISFQSAEILTIPELSTCIHQSISNFNNVSPSGNGNPRANAHAHAHANSNQLQCTFQGKTVSDVRITGVLLHMVMNTNTHSTCTSTSTSTSNQSFMILGDALFIKPKSKSKLGMASFGNGRRNGVTASSSMVSKFGDARRTGVGSTGTNNISTSSSTITTDTRTAACSSSSSSLAFNNRNNMNTQVQTQKISMIGTSLSGKKRRLVTVKPRTHNNLLRKQPNKLFGNPSLLRRSTPSDPGTNTSTSASINASTSTSTITPRSTLRVRSSGFSSSKKHTNSHPRDPKEEEMIQKLRQGMHMVVVDVTDMACVDGCKVDDMVMVIGTIQFHCLGSASVSEGHRSSGNTGLCGDRMKGMMDKILKDHPLGTMQCNNMDNDEKGVAAMGPLYGANLEARIVQVVNGTDMNLLQEALKMRRECLKDFEGYGGKGRNRFDIIRGNETGQGSCETNV